MISSDLSQIVNRYVKGYKIIKHIKLEKSNLATILNHSIKLTKTKYYARMDSDDISMPNRFKSQYDFLENNSDVYMVGGWAVEFKENINFSNLFIKKVPDNYPQIVEFYHYRNPLIHPTVMFRMDLFNIIGSPYLSKFTSF